MSTNSVLKKNINNKLSILIDLLLFLIILKCFLKNENEMFLLSFIS